MPTGAPDLVDFLGRIRRIRIVSISEAARSDLYNGLVEMLGPDRAETLMSAIPLYDLYDLDDVATKRDLQVLKAELRAEFTALLSAEVGGLPRAMTSWMLTQSVAIIGASSVSHS